jgi:hypothetical protein
MSIKHQNRLTIFASLIIGVSALAFVGLNFIVDKISKINTSHVAQQEARGPRLQDSQKHGSDDALKPEDNNPDPNQMPNAPGMPSSAPDRQVAPSNNPTRRVNNTKNSADFEQKTAPAPSQRPTTMPMQQQPDMRHAPPPGYPDPSRMTPEQREAFEIEMYRRQQLMQEYDYPPPEYYQGPGPYDRGYEDDYYDYDPGYRGQKTDAKSSAIKLSDSAPNYDYDEEDDDEYDPDDYLEEDLE